MSFAFTETALPGCVAITPQRSADERGLFVKTFHQTSFAAQGLNTSWPEQYHSVSRRGVLRGLHFQMPPRDHEKLVYCSSGAILDAAIDLRKGSPTFGEHLLIELDAEAGTMLYLPRGLAHGFYVTSEQATMHYLVSTEYAPSEDAGLLFSSAGIDWPDSSPILSPRDETFPPLCDFESPFIFKEH